MARKTDIRLRRSDTAGKIPTSANLSDGELALNTNSGALYFKKSDDTIITVHDNTILHIDSDTTADSETGSNPKVGIGTTSPDYALDIRDNTNIQLKLSSIGASANARMVYAVNNTQKWNHGVVASNDEFTFYDVTTPATPFKLQQGAATNTLVVHSSSRIGIGTSAPQNKLHVKSGTVNTAVARFTGANNDRGLVISTAVSGITNDSIINYDAVSTNSVGQHVFKTDGTERVRINASGSLGIGTNAPATKLHISESSDQTSPQLRITNDNSESLTMGVVRSIAGTAPDTSFISFDNSLRFIGQTGTTNERMRITEAGNVGINTTNPTTPLDVHGIVRVEENSNTAFYGGDYVRVFSNQSYRFRNSGGTTKAQIHMAGNSYFNGGNVGIGTTSPGALLEVNSDGSNADGAVLLLKHANNNTTDVISTIKFANNGGSVGSIQVGTAGSNATGYITFNTDITNTSAERMRIHTNGYVGIGTSSPLATLHVGSASGSLNSSAELFIPAGDALMRTLKIGHGSSTASITTDDSSKPITFTAGGSERVRIDTSGRVGIKNSSPSSQFFNTLVVGDTSGDNGITIQSSATGRGALAFSDTDAATSGRYDGYINYSHNATYMSFHVNTGNEQMRIDSTGRVLINTTSSVHSAAKLQVVGDTSSFARIALKDADGSNNIAYIDKEGAQLGFTSQNGTSHGTIALKSYDGTSTVSRLTIDQNGAITFNSAFTFPNSIGSAGQVLKVPSSGTTLQWANETGGGGATDGIEDADGDTKIQVEESADEDVIRFDTAGTERMLISASGDVSMNRRLYLAGAGQEFIQSAGSLRIDIDHDNNQTDRIFVVSKHNTATELMRVQENGRVGIGTTSPGQELDVAGNIRVQNNAAFMGTNVAGSSRSLVHLDSNNVLKIKGNDSEGSNNVISMIAGGNVGIGTTSPSYHLDIDPASTSTAMRIKGDGHASLIIDRASTSYDANLSFVTAGVTKWRLWNDSTDASLQIRDEGNLISNVMTWYSGGNVGIGVSVPTAKLHIVHNDTSDALLLETTEASNLAGPVLTFKRNSASPADADYLGQLKFKGENDADQEVVYAKITSKISDQTDGTEDGVIEFAVRKAGSNNINMRLGPNTLQLINGTGLTVAGDATITGNLTVDGTTTTLNTATLDVEDKNITLNYGSGDTSATADGAGITIQDAVDSSTNATILWDGTNDEFDFSHAINTAGPITAQRIIGTQTQGSSLYGLQLTRSASGTTTPDLWGQNGTLVIGTSSSTEAVAFSSADSFFYGDLTIPNKIIHSGDTDTYIQFTDGEIDFFANGRNGFMTSSGGFVVNPGLHNYDFIVRGDTDTSLLYVDASTDNVGIGTATPDHKLEISSDMASSPTGVVFLRKTGTNAVGGGGAIRFDTSASNDDHTIHYASVEGVRSSTDNGSNTLLFKTSKVGVNSNAPTTKMVIDEDGRVGIGTTAPNSTCSLEVYKNDGSNSVIRIHEDAGNDAARLHLRSGGNDAYIQLPNTSDGLEIRTEQNLISGSAALKLNTNGKAEFGYAVKIEEYQIDTTETSTTATTQVAIHTFTATDFRSARFTIQITNSTDSTYHTSEILLVHDGTTAYITEFGEIHTGTAEEATFDADISSGSVRLLATPASTDSMEFKVVCHSVTV